VSGNKTRSLDWEDILTGLVQLYRDNPSVLECNVLVGGAACFFYRDRLKLLNDPDFQVPNYLPEEEKFWLSHDADFATTDPGAVPTISGKVPIGTVQCGFVIGADEFKENARTVELRWEDTTFTMFIADPLDLWREKEAAIYRVRRPQDGLHLHLLELVLQWEFADLAGQVAMGVFPAVQWIARAKEVKRRWNSILNSQKLRDRLIAANVPEITDFVDGSPDLSI
jgi:hypothetical protein